MEEIKIVLKRKKERTIKNYRAREIEKKGRERD